MKKLILLILSLFLIETSQAQIVNPNPPGSTNWASPGAIGSITPNNGKFTYLTTNEVITGLLSQGAFSYGTLSYTDINISASFAGNQNNYFQHIVQNANAGTAASADYVVSNNLGTASTYYGDFGITSSGYNTPGQNIINIPNAVYFQSQSADVAVGTLTANGIHLVTNLVDRLDISATGVLSGPSLTGFMSAPSAIGNVTPSTGAFTTATATTFTGALVGNASTATSATTATTAANIAGGSANSVPYQTGAGATAFVAPGTNGYILQMVSGTPAWANTSGVFNPAAVAITGGQINGTTIGATTPSTGAFNQVTVNPASATMTEFQVGSGSTTLAGIYIGNDISGYGAIWPTAVSPTTTNYAFAAGAVTYLNNPSSVVINIAGSPLITVSADTATIKGTVLGGNAAAGQVGEYTSNTATGVSAAANTGTNIVTLSLTAGDWNVEGGFLANGGSLTGLNYYDCGLSTTPAALPVGYYNTIIYTTVVGGNPGGPLTMLHVSTTSATTIYLVCVAGATSGSATMQGVLEATRIH